MSCFKFLLNLLFYNASIGRKTRNFLELFHAWDSGTGVAIVGSTHASTAVQYVVYQRARHSGDACVSPTFAMWDTGLISSAQS